MSRAVFGREVRALVALPQTYGIAAGNHNLEVSADGYKPQKKEILVSAGQPLTLNFKLEIIPKTGKAHITANQPLSEVRIDDKVGSCGIAS